MINVTPDPAVGTLICTRHKTGRRAGSGVTRLLVHDSRCLVGSCRFFMALIKGFNKAVVDNRLPLALLRPVRATGHNGVQFSCEHHDVRLAIHG